MDKAHRTILDTLRPSRRPSKLEPYRELIVALRRQGRSYREIVTILRERCELRVGLHAVYHFVRARTARPQARGHKTRPRLRSTTRSP